MPPCPAPGRIAARPMNRRSPSGEIDRSDGARVAHRMHHLRCPVGFSGTRQASAPAPGVRLELGPLGRCLRPLPRAPTLEDRTILGLIMAFWGTPHDRPRERHPAGSGQNGRVTMQTEVISGAALPQRAGAPASSPIPPQARDRCSWYDGFSSAVLLRTSPRDRHRWQRVQPRQLRHRYQSGEPRAPQSKHQSADRGWRVTVDCA
jgi:hypothetical protein